MMEIHAVPSMPRSSMAMLAPLPAQLGGGATEAMPKIDRISVERHGKRDFFDETTRLARIIMTYNYRDII